MLAKRIGSQILFVLLRHCPGVSANPACCELLRVIKPSVVNLRTMRAVLVLAAGLHAAHSAFAAAANKPTHKVAPTLWGLFFEGISLSTDGVLDADPVRNRSFEESDKHQQFNTRTVL